MHSMRKFPLLKRDESTGLGYYNFPTGYPLYKATRRLEQGTLTLNPNQLYFFGPKNDDPEYIEGYEYEYGIIFEFVTANPCNLLAIDDEKTQKILYDEAPENIKAILKSNYGYNTKSGFRDSKGDSDNQLSQYLCEKGYQGYAANSMPTQTGELNPELMICNATKIVNFVAQVTNTNRVRAILEEGEARKRAEELRESRKKRRPIPITEEEKDDTQPNIYAFASRLLYNTPPNTPPRGDSTRNDFNTPPGTPLRGSNSHQLRTPSGGKRKSRKSKIRKNKRKSRSHKK